MNTTLPPVDVVLPKSSAKSNDICKNLAFASFKYSSKKEKTPTLMQAFRKLEQREHESLRKLSSLWRNENTEARRREAELAKFSHPHFHSIAQELVATYGESEDITVVIKFQNKSDVVPLEQWNEAHIHRVLSDLAKFHSAFLNQTQQLSHLPLIEKNAEDRKQQREFLQILLEQMTNQYPAIYEHKYVNKINVYLSKFEFFAKMLDKSPKTMIHNHCLPENLKLQKKEDGFQLTMSDWSFASIDTPQRDLCELLNHLLVGQNNFDLYQQYVDYYHQQLELFTGKSIDHFNFWTIYRFANIVYNLERISLLSLLLGEDDSDVLGNVVKSQFYYSEMIDQYCYNLMLHNHA